MNCVPVENIAQAARPPDFYDIKETSETLGKEGSSPEYHHSLPYVKRDILTALPGQEDAFENLVSRPPVLGPIEGPVAVHP